MALASCRTLSPVAVGSWPERRSALQALDHYEVNGQMAAATTTEGYSASMRWQQQGTTSDLLLRAPLGMGGARLNFDGAVLRITNSQGLQLEGSAADAEMLRLLGFRPPLSSLRYWLLGVPDPGSEALESVDSQQRLTKLQQGEWQIDYLDYSSSANQWMPHRVELHHGPVRLKLQLAHWQIQ